MPRPRVPEHTKPITTWQAAFARFHELWGSAREAAKLLADVPDAYDKRAWGDLLEFLENQATAAGYVHPTAPRSRRDSADPVKSRPE